MKTIGFIAAVLASLGGGNFALCQSENRIAPARPGWRLVDGYYAKPAAKVKVTELVRLVDEEGRHLLVVQPAGWVEPMLRNWRLSVIEMEGSTYAWKLSCRGRVWNDNRSGGTQHLQLIAATDEMATDTTMRLTKIDITPDQASIQALINIDNRPTSVCVVLSRRFAELSIGAIGETQAAIIHRAESARHMFRQHPGDARKYMLPVLRAVAAGANVMQPGAADVYRAFPDMPVDPLVTTTIDKLLPDLADRDPRVRRRASEELASLGRRGVQSAMKIDIEPLAPEAADRIAAYIRDNIRDDRPGDQLVKDANFLLDCLADSDPNVAAAAGKAVEAVVKPQHK